LKNGADSKNGMADAITFCKGCGRLRRRIKGLVTKIFVSGYFITRGRTANKSAVPVGLATMAAVRAAIRGRVTTTIPFPTASGFIHVFFARNAVSVHIALKKLRALQRGIRG